MTPRKKKMLGQVGAIAVAAVAKRTVRADAAALGLTVVQVGALTLGVSAVLGFSSSSRVRSLHETDQGWNP